MDATTLWWLTLAGGAAVVIVVAILLAAILATARQIRGTLSEIWVSGKMVANNTAHVDLLRRLTFAVTHMRADLRAASNDQEGEVKR
jgi:hypothetical protein